MTAGVFFGTHIMILIKYDFDNRKAEKDNHLVNKETVSCQCSIVLFTNPSDMA